ncbi:hypothetical protein DOY81_008710 [Sarcophaga bullata]|nr:hypothetical protein DOY81_008710 [Sarcophaga bullata]
MGSIDKACISGFLCRLCSEMHRIVIHIYGDQGQRLCLVEKINGYLPITISPTDPLPKTICTTCLRRVEQHYDLLMRLSRIKEERFLRQRPRVTPISSIENSEDELYPSDDETRRVRQLHDTSHRQMPPSQTPSFLSAPTTSSSVSAASSSIRTTEVAGISLMNVGPSDNSVDHEGDDSSASTSANALASITESVVALNDSSTSSSLYYHSIDDGNSLALQQHSD